MDAEKQEPLFSCQDEFCRAEYSWPASDMRVWNGKPICENCFDDALCEEPWEHLPAFVPEHQKRIGALEAENARLRNSNLALTTQLAFYADQLCEGWCQGKDPKACAAIGEDNCAGCPAVVTISRHTSQALKGEANDPQS